MVDSPGDNDGWHEWSRYIRKELKRLGDCYENLQRDVGEIKTEIAALKVKSTVWGALAGLLVAIAAILLGLLK